MEELVAPSTAEEARTDMASGAGGQLDGQGPSLQLHEGNSLDRPYVPSPQETVEASGADTKAVSVPVSSAYANHPEESSSAGSRSRLWSRWNSRLDAFAELTGKWRGVHLKTLQQDDSYTQILLNHEDLQIGRKLVSAQTKEFSKLDNEGKMNEFGTLLKQYQKHVDQIMKHLKFSERAYISLYDSVKGITDPYPLMEKFAREKETILNFIAEAESKEALLEELRSLEAELQGTRSQEATIQHLRRQLAESEMSSLSKVEESANDADAEYHSILAHWQQRELEMQREISTARLEIVKKDLEIRDLSAALLHVRTQMEEASVKNERELDNLVMEIEDARGIIGKKDEELRRLAEQHQQLLDAYDQTDENGGGGGGVGMTPAAPTPGADKRSTEVVERRLQDELDDERREWEKSMATEMESLGSELARRNDLAVELQNRLARCEQERDRISEELRGAQREYTRLHEFSQIQKTQADELRLAVQELERENVTLSRKVEQLEANKPGTRLQSPLVQQKQLTQQLRSDDFPVGEGSRGEGGDGAAHKGDGFDLEVVVASAAEGVVARRKELHSEVAGLSAETQSTEPSAEPRPPLPDVGDVDKDPFLVVAAQRDKLRQRLLTLEEVSSSQIHSLKLELAALTNENQMLRSQTQGGSTSRFLRLGGILNSARAEEGRAGISDEYLMAKEKTFPTLHFHDGQIFSKRSALAVLDYGAGAFSLFVMSSMVARRVFMVYLTLLHMYLFVSFFRH